jgi:hypothetical protein
MLAVIEAGAAMFVVWSLAYFFQCERFGTDGRFLPIYGCVVSPGCSKFSGRSPKRPVGSTVRIGSRIKSQAKFQTAARRESFGGFP